MRTWELIRLAVEGVLRTPLRAILTAVGVSIATGALVSMVGFALGLQANIEEPFHRMEFHTRINDWPPPAPSEDEKDDAPTTEAIHI